MRTEFKKISIYDKIVAHTAIDVQVALIVKSCVGDLIVVVGVVAGGIGAGPVMCPFPFALGGGGGTQEEKDGG